MRSPYHITLTLALFFSITLNSLRSEIEFIGVLSDTKNTQVGLTDTTTQESRWLKPGETFNGFTVGQYDAKDESVILHTKDNAKIFLKLKSSVVGSIATPPPPAARDEYVVQAGDGGAKIAQNFGLSLPELQALNPNVNWAKLRVGQKVRIK